MAIIPSTRGHSLFGRTAVDTFGNNQPDLTKDFASKLPTKLRAPFKRLVDEVHEPRRTPLPTLKFFKTYGNLAS